MATAAAPENPETRRPSVVGSLAYLLSSFPIGLAAFIVLLTLSVLGIGTAIIWVGLPIIAIVVLLTRGAAQLERARVHALLGTYIPTPARPLASGDLRQRWRTRLTDSVTWREYCYLFLLLPLGSIGFVLMVACWSVSLALLGLPVYYRFLPGGVWHFPSNEAGLRWLTVDSVPSALPWAALGVLLVIVTASFTRALGAGQARFAWSMLGPTAARVRELNDLNDEADGTVGSQTPLAGRGQR